MRIAIVGGGGAGLTTAWLLEQQHEVTLFEQDDRLGGHAHTIEVEADGQRFGVDAGFQFFGEGAAYATFNRLLDALEVPRRSYRATMTLFRGADAIAMPPVRGGVPDRGSLSPASVAHLARLWRFITDVRSFMERHDTSVTMREYLQRQRLPVRFVEEFLIPLLLSFWCLEREEFLDTAAYNTLFYLNAMSERFWSPRQSEIEGGMRTYVNALARNLTRSDVRVGVGIRGMSRSDVCFVLDDTAGGRHEFDVVVLATSAADASTLVGPMRGLQERARWLARFEFFDAVIAIHGDRRLMPARESAWSVINARWDGAHSQLSIWNADRGLPVFRSWVTYEERMPDPLYALVTYRHGRGTTAHFDAQRRLAAMQGEHGLWLAGMYTDDADSHESAVHSAVTIAQRLAPGSDRLGMLVGSRGVG